MDDLFDFRRQVLTLDDMEEELVNAIQADIDAIIQASAHENRLICRLVEQQAL